MGMAITPTDIGGDENIARRVIVLAKSIAPCIDTFADESEEKKNAIAILSAVVGEVKLRGARNVVAQRQGAASVTYDVGSAFKSDDRDALRALCGATSSSTGQPVGSFPTGRPVGRVWPEEY